MSDAARILVVDDEPYITDLLGAALRFEGFEVETAATGADAMTLAQRGSHDLVLLDVMLPDVDRHRGVPAAAGRGVTGRRCCS